MVLELRSDRRRMVFGGAAGLALAGMPFLRAAAQTPVAGGLPPEGAAFLDRNATAGELAHAWFAMLSLTGAETGALGTTVEQDARSREIIRPLLDPAFILQRASGERYVASTYVPADIDLFEIVDVVETRPSDSLVVARYAARTTGASTADSSLLMSDELAPRLTVFHWDAGVGQWKVLSHANFSTPVAAICDDAPLAPPTNPPVPTSTEDIALAMSLTEQISQLALQGDTRPMLDPEVQGQSASGRGYAGIANFTPHKYTRFEASDFLVTRNDDLLVVAYLALQAGTLIGEDVQTARDPRIVTWRRDENGEWKLVAHGIFATPAELPVGEACVKST